MADARVHDADIVGWDRHKVREWALASAGLGAVAIVLGIVGLGAPALLVVGPVAVAWAAAGAVPALRMREHPVMLQLGPDGIAVLDRGPVPWDDVEAIAVSRVCEATDLRVVVRRDGDRELRAPIGFADRPVARLVTRLEAYGVNVVAR